jgi:predicted transcriptional regulator
MSKKLRNRGWMEITVDILRLCEEGGKNKTAIMYGSKLSFAQMNRYFKELENEHLIEKVMRDGKPVYRATTKGKTLLAAYEELIRMIIFDRD